MKVVHITFSSGGGAGSVATDLQKFQISTGIDSEIYCLTSGDIKSVILRRPFLFFTSLIDYLLVKRSDSKGLFTLFRRGFNFRGKDLSRSGLVLHIHWHSGLISLSEFLTLCNKSVPMLITLHDMLPITGGCHFSNGCDNHLSGCEACPQVRKHFQRHVLNRYQKKTMMYKKNPALGFTTPGPWLLEHLRNSPISSGIRSQLIYNPIDSSFFKLGDSKAIRDTLKVPKNAFVIGCCAVNVRDPRKRIDLIIKAWNSIQENNNAKREIWLIVVGGDRLQRNVVKAGRLIKMPLIKSRKELADIYSIFDVLCSMSSAETFPNIVHECAAMGVPSILSAIPGHKHAIGNFALGVDSEEALGEGILTLESNQDLHRELRLNALKFASTLDQSIINEFFLREYKYLFEISKR